MNGEMISSVVSAVFEIMVVGTLIATIHYLDVKKLHPGKQGVRWYFQYLCKSMHNKTV